MLRVHGPHMLGGKERRNAALPASVFLPQQTTMRFTARQATSAGTGEKITKDMPLWASDGIICLTGILIGITAGLCVVLFRASCKWLATFTYEGTWFKMVLGVKALLSSAVGPLPAIAGFQPEMV